MTQKVDLFWQEYLTTLPVDRAATLQQPEAWGFGDGPQMADALGQLVADGTKTATCGALWEYEAEGEALPAVGGHEIILNGAGEPLCIIETLEVTVQPFDAVDAAFAAEEGEGDRTLRYWREAHERFFRRTLPAIDREFSTAMPLVCERFRVVWPKKKGKN